VFSLYEQSPRWTFIFIGVAVLAFLFQQATDLWVELAFFPAFALEAPWMFLTSIFLHADISHLFFNMLGLFFFGTYLERVIGRSSFAALFLASGVLGNAGYMLTASDPFVPAIGASGALYGVIGTLATLAPLMLVYIYGFLPVPMVLAAVGWGFFDVVGLFVPSGIAHGAHLGGMFVGIAFGLYLRMRIRRLRRR